MSAIPAISVNSKSMNVRSRYKPSAARIEFNAEAIPLRGPPPFSKFETLHKRLPSRLPGPDCATMFTLIGLGMLTINPSTFRFRGPRVSVRIGQVPVATTGAATLFNTVVIDCPAALVSVATRFPTATNWGWFVVGSFCTAKWLTFKTPVIVPLPSALPPGRVLNGPDDGAAKVPLTGMASEP